MSDLTSRSDVMPIQKGARLINCYGELSSEDNEYYIYKRPGISTTPVFSIIGKTLGMGMYVDPA
ncbi:MAG: hypothetical protein ACREQ5_39945, partial [Candidatus Dormibacteria bacterium]